MRFAAAFALCVAFPAAAQIVGPVRIQITDGSGNAITSTSSALDINVKSGSLAANQSVNVAQVNGVTPLMGAGNTGTGSPRVTVATDQAALPAWGQGATGSAVPAGGAYIGGIGSGNLLGFKNCDNWTPISIASATTTKIIALASAKTTYICSFHLYASGTVSAAWISGTKVTNECDTTTAGLAGGTTAATGYAFIAQTGIAAAGTLAPIMATATTAKDVCIITTGTGQLSGVVNWTQF